MRGRSDAGRRGCRGSRFRRRVAVSLCALGSVLLGVPGTGHAAARASQAAAKATKYYVSLGDSYSVGYQPSPTAGATAGYTAVVAKKTHLTLENFGCGGATTISILNTKGCTSPYGPPAATGGVPYPTQTQAAAAEAFISAHVGQIGLITVSISGNDLLPCANSSDPITCVANALGPVNTNVSTLAQGLRAAAGSGVPIIGLTYPDVLLGLWVYPPGSPDQSLATLSVSAFKQYLNPSLSSAYSSVSGALVDVTTATGAYIPLTKMVTLKPYGKIPQAVADVCQYTWYCSLGNIHADTKGYTLIGNLVVKEYKKLVP